MSVYVAQCQEGEEDLLGLAGESCSVAGCQLCFGTGCVTGSPDQVFELRESVRAPGVVAA